MPNKEPIVEYLGNRLQEIIEEYNPIQAKSLAAELVDLMKNLVGAAYSNGYEAGYKNGQSDRKGE